MSTPNENDRDFKAQSYLRLLRYARPYWKRLTIGIVAGIMVGSSIFVGLMMVPRLVGVVVDATATSGRATAVDTTPEAVKNDPQLAKLLNDIAETGVRYHLPYSVEGVEVKVHWPVSFSFELVDPRTGCPAWQIFAIYALVFVLAWTVKSVALYINGYCTRWVGAKVVADMREEIFRKLTRQSMRFYSNMDVGHLISRCTNDTSALEYSVSNSIEDLTNAPLQVLACVAAILIACRDYGNYSLVFILLLGLPLLIVPLHVIGRKIRKIYKKSFARIADVFSRMHEVFSGIPVVKACHAEAREIVRFEQVDQRYLRQVFKALRLHLLIAPSMELVAVTATLVFLVYAYSQGISLTQLSALLAPAFMAYRPIKDISKVVAALQKAMAAADRFFHLLDTDTELKEKPDAKVLTEFKQEIRFDEVEFRYDDKLILDRVSFTIPRGHVVAVVGETGSGKSTIANLIARFYDVNSGSVSIDGVDVRDYTIDSLLGVIGIVNQEPVLFNESIADNIAYGRPESTREEIIEAAKLANAHDFIVSGRHPEGYDTIVGERGFKLSGGEKQRVAIARAILRNPPILILDEATSALDTVTERLVQEALTRVMSNRTVFAIAHRLSTIQHADRILVLRDGVIAESGTHEELLAFGGIYRRLYDTQFS